MPTTPSPYAIVSILIWVIYLTYKELIPFLRSRSQGASLALNGHAKISNNDIHKLITDLSAKIGMVQGTTTELSDRVKGLSEAIATNTKKSGELDTEVRLLKNALIGYDGNSGLLDDMKGLWKKHDALEHRVNQFHLRADHTR